MNMSLRLADVTYGELYQFVAAAQAAGVPPEEKVRCIGSDDQGDRFELDLSNRVGNSPAKAAAALTAPTASTPSATPDRPSAQGVTEALRSYIRSEGDVDKIISMLGEMRKFLR